MCLLDRHTTVLISALPFDRSYYHGTTQSKCQHIAVHHSLGWLSRPSLPMGAWSSLSYLPVRRSRPLLWCRTRLHASNRQLGFLYNPRSLTVVLRLCFPRLLGMQTVSGGKEPRFGCARKGSETASTAAACLSQPPTGPTASMGQSREGETSGSDCMFLILCIDMVLLTTLLVSQ